MGDPPYIPGKKPTGLEPHPCAVYLLTLSLANYIFLRSSSEEQERWRRGEGRDDDDEDEDEEVRVFQLVPGFFLGPLNLLLILLLFLYLILLLV